MHMGAHDLELGGSLRKWRVKSERNSKTHTPSGLPTGKHRETAASKLLYGLTLIDHEGLRVDWFVVADLVEDHGPLTDPGAIAGDVGADGPVLGQRQCVNRRKIAEHFFQGVVAFYLFRSIVLPSRHLRLQGHVVHGFYVAKGFRFEEECDDFLALSFLDVVGDLMQLLAIHLLQAVV